MTPSPLIVYLDTQDYIRIFNEPDDGPAHTILRQLIAFRDQGNIVIGYSWVTILEFITRPTDRHREERVRRGQLVKDICGQNAFPFFTALKQGARFPNKGLWLTAPDGRVVTAKWFRQQMEKHYLQLVTEERNLNRSQRRRLKTPSTLKKILRNTSSTWGTKREDFGDIPVSDEFLESGVMARFLRGECSDAEFEERLNRWLSDPAEFSRLVYDYADKPNLLDEFIGPSITKMECALKQVQEAINTLDSLDNSIREHRRKLTEAGLDKAAARRLTKPMPRPTLDPTDLILNIEDHVGKGRADHVGHYMLKALRKDYSFKPSDLMDIAQLCYVPDCDLFRCDKAMADLFRDHKPFAGKLVAKFADLPGRIEERLAECGR
ncbi:hypothetical protein PARHAE_03956 [Paracoccus haematequi]|uniref:Uncharacterized protein n=1 Tax=Paracoccus haematequi TaxID=2491866 RepID=A0A447IT94_9RHOB|nr:hypothetical protein [Paracoccus haematequi]VDS10737.1 hypothetical protein PARHAE_03956 [Paracoccus haematequi]